MYSFFKKPRPINVEFPFKKDIHAHLIPNIDDGPSSLEESVAMVKQLRDLGYEQLTATPHVFSEYYPNKKVDILTGLSVLKNAVAEANITIEINAGAEYFLENTFEELLHTESLLTISGNQILVEMSTFGAPLNLYDLLKQIQVKGYQPILAHPERYLYLDQKDYKKLLDVGCTFQLNMLSANGYYGRAVQKQAFLLIKNDWTHFIGTDVHSLNQVELISNLVGTNFFDFLLGHRQKGLRNFAQALGLV